MTQDDIVYYQDAARDVIVNQVVRELGYNMTVPEFSDMIRNDPNFFYDNPDDLMKGFEDLVYNVIPPKLPDVFMNIPMAKLT
nr:uncharacterized protein LOC128705704 [Cherax quadricarinatus]